MKEGRFPTLVSSHLLASGQIARRNEGGSVSDPRSGERPPRTRRRRRRNEGGSVSDPRWGGITCSGIAAPVAAMKEGRFPTLVSTGRRCGLPPPRRNEGGSVSDPRSAPLRDVPTFPEGRNEGGSVSDPR